MSLERNNHSMAPAGAGLGGGSLALCLLAGLVLLLGGAALNFAYLLNDCPLNLAGDEAHYWEWSRRLDWSYYSKGPLVAYIIAAGRYFLANWSDRAAGSEVLAVRVPAMLLSVATGLGLFTLTQNVFRRPIAALGALLILATVPICAAGALLMTIDAPLICLWTWTLVCIERALAGNRRWPWLAAGLLVALGIMAKYTMVLVYPALLLTAFFAIETRAALRRPWAWIGGALGLLGFLPIVIWNAEHDWVSFRHVAMQAGLADRARPGVLGVLEYAAGQAVVLNPVWLVGMLAAIATWTRSAAPTDGEAHRAVSVRLLWSAAIIPWAVFLGFSPFTKIEPNWPAMAIIPGVALLAGWAARRSLWQSRTTRRRLIWSGAAGTAIGVAVLVLARWPDLLAPVYQRLARAAPPWELTPVVRYDPTARLRGWSKLAALDDLLASKQRAGRNPFILADDYQLASEIAFYCPSHPDVYCAQAALGGRQSQYDIWTNPIRDAAQFVGRPCIYVGSLKPQIAGDETHAAALPNLTKLTTIEHVVGGLRYQLWGVYWCDAFAGFPARADAATAY